MRAARLRTCRMPRSPTRTRSPFFSDLVIAAKNSSNRAIVDFFCISCFSASAEAICFAVTVTVVVVAAALATGLSPQKRCGELRVFLRIGSCYRILDRQRGVKGKSVSGSIDVGGRRRDKKKIDKRKKTNQR